MPTFSSGNGAFTPSTTNDNWTIDSVGTGVFGKVIGIGWGGRLIASTGYRTRWTRPTTAGITKGAQLAIQAHQPNYNTPAFTVTATYTTQPVLPADPSNLWAQDWNAQGGTGAIYFPLNNPWFVATGVLQGALSCRNVAGVDASGSSYEVTWEE